MRENALADPLPCPSGSIWCAYVRLWTRVPPRLSVVPKAVRVNELINEGRLA